MKYADTIELSNIQVYEVGDVQIENLVLKALAAGIKEIVVGPCALDLVEKMLEDHDNITINCAVSYPSGAYLLEQKIQEIQDLIDEQKRIDAFYVVMSEGQYLSGHVAEMKEELTEIVHASNNIPVKIVTEDSARALRFSRTTARNKLSQASAVRSGERPFCLNPATFCGSSFLNSFCGVPVRMNSSSLRFSTRISPVSRMKSESLICSPSAPRPI